MDENMNRFEEAKILWMNFFVAMHEEGDPKEQAMFKELLPIYGTIIEALSLASPKGETHKPEDCPMKGIYPSGYMSYSDQCNDCAIPSQDGAKALEDFMSMHDYFICPNDEVALNETRKIYYSIRETIRASLSPQGEDWKSWGIIDIAIRNPNVSSYMEHWEGRALKSENELATFQSQPAAVVELQCLKTDDAMQWAKDFMETITSRNIKIEEDFMLGWFANAIEVSHSIRLSRAAQRQPAAGVEE